MTHRMNTSYLHIACLQLTAPVNGNIDCSVGDDGETNVGETCTFTCHDGYELSGSVKRSCLNEQSWSGSETMCTPSMSLLYVL